MTGTFTFTAYFVPTAL